MGQTKMKISIIVPVFNEERLIVGCLDSVINQDYPKRNYEIIVVNDGSTDNTLTAIKRKQKEAEKKSVKIKIVNLERNQGRVIARETGATNSKYNNLLFIDSRCITDKNVLKIVKSSNYQPIIGYVSDRRNRSVFDRFNCLIRKIKYSSHFEENFKPVYITKDNFDEMGKGTGIFFCDKELFLHSQLKDITKYGSDDTKLLWNIVQKKKILIHPDVKVTYLSRTSLKKEIKHTFERGPKFVDYYLHLRKRRFWLFIFFPIATLILTIILTFFNLTYLLYWLGFLILILILSSIWISENISDFFVVLTILPIIGFSFELGILRGLILKLLRKY